MKNYSPQFSKNSEENVVSVFLNKRLSIHFHNSLSKIFQFSIVSFIKYIPFFNFVIIYDFSYKKSF